MKNKKLLSILAVTMLAGVALTGCNNETGSTSSNSSHEETSESHSQATSSESDSQVESSVIEETTSSENSTEGDTTSDDQDSSISESITIEISVTISGDDSVRVGESIQLTANVEGSTQGVTWTSESSTTATVSATGSVTGVAPGEVVIKATSVEDNTKFATKTITVLDQEAKKNQMVFAEQGDNVDNPLPDDQMSYWNDQGWLCSYVTMEKAYEQAGVYYVTWSSVSHAAPNGFSMQLFYKNTSLTAGKSYNLTFKLNSSVAGKIRVNDQVFDIEEGDNNIAVTYTEKGGNNGSLHLINGTADPVTMIENGSFIISELNWSLAPTKLAAPEGVVLNYATDHYIVAFAPVQDANGYDVQILDGKNNEPVGDPVSISAPGETVDFSDLEDGAYKVKVRAKGNGEDSVDSDWKMGQGFANVGDITFQAPAEQEDIPFGVEGMDYLPNKDLLLLNTYSYWNIQEASYVTVNEASVLNDTATFKFQATGPSSSYGFQVFYKNTTLTEGTRYALSFKLDSSFAGNVTINGVEKTLQVGENEIEVEYTEGPSYNASFKLVVSSEYALSQEVTLKIKNPQWSEPKTAVKFETPVGLVLNPLPDQPNKYVVAFAPVTGANTFEVEIVNQEKSVLKTISEIGNGGVIDFNELGSGEYAVRVRAKGDGVTTLDSEWSDYSNYITIA